MDVRYAEIGFTLMMKRHIRDPTSLPNSRPKKSKPEQKSEQICPKDNSKDVRAGGE